MAKAGFRQCYAKTPELRSLHLSPAFLGKWYFTKRRIDSVDIHLYIYINIYIHLVANRMRTTWSWLLLVLFSCLVLVVVVVVVVVVAVVVVVNVLFYLGFLSLPWQQSTHAFASWQEPLFYRKRKHQITLPSKKIHPPPLIHFR